MRFRTAAFLPAMAAILSAAVAHADDGLVDEAKIGLSAHDVPIGDEHKEGGVDANGEVLFISPDLLRAVFAPRPHVGLMVNSEGKNSYAYAGLTWTATMAQGLFDANDSLFAGLGLGGAVHDGPMRAARRIIRGSGRERCSMKASSSAIAEPDAGASPRSSTTFPTPVSARTIPD